MQSKVFDYISGESHHDRIIRVDYSPYALNQARLIERNGIDDQAVRRKYEEGVSIDGIESLDLDDAIWVERTSEGYAVFVHISDVTEAVPTYTYRGAQTDNEHLSERGGYQYVSSRSFPKPPFA